MDRSCRKIGTVNWKIPAEDTMLVSGLNPPRRRIYYFSLEGLGWGGGVLPGEGGLFPLPVPDGLPVVLGPLGGRLFAIVINLRVRLIYKKIINISPCKLENFRLDHCVLKVMFIFASQ